LNESAVKIIDSIINLSKRNNIFKILGDLFRRNIILERRKKIMKKHNLKNIRIKNRITQLELSKLLKKNVSIISKYENNNLIPEIETLEKYSKFFHVSIDYLIGNQVNNNLIEIYNLIADKIFNIIEKNNIDFKRLSSSLNISENELILYLSGYKIPSLSMFKKILAELHIQKNLC
jgi:transcriptional regulator with XRE-family HTH domain